MGWQARPLLPAGVKVPGGSGWAGAPPLLALQVPGQLDAHSAADAQEECYEELRVELQHHGSRRRGRQDLVQCTGGLGQSH